eukprot:CAMPEP_0176476668 /NCGR_PEP_ID=MMETSP0200_2-20121128/182_1 /TAXON_ID=947934 /ORGANISM="Chaetoceros sp., Strain GSL56" /LENGTH=422 /DNA_ID=CAMNT_0017872367 /DNA_START=682 /DNA_END=1950 /DNA_ORIENTATION=+
MKIASAAVVLIFSLSVSDARSTRALKEKKGTKSSKSKKSKSSGGLCIVGCTPYVDPTDNAKGILKWQALVQEMAENCDVMVHVGDTKAGAAVCNEDLMTGPIHTMIEAGKETGTAVLYSPGDNELNDCHRDGSRVPPRPADYYKAADARNFLISDLGVNNAEETDLTGQYKVDFHTKSGIIPGTNNAYDCAFDKYYADEKEGYAVATLEVLGSQWYLADQSGSSTYPNQDSVDPLADRLGMYLNAKDCALEWIEQSAAKAHASGLRSVVFAFQAHYWNLDVYGNVVGHLPAAGIGEYYKPENLAAMTEALTGEAISEPFQPLYDKLTEVAFNYPNIMFYVAHADSHIWTNIRQNSYATNVGDNIISHQNLMILQVEGDSRALTQYAKLTFEKDDFQPVTPHQIWSEVAYALPPYGHSFVKYQ